MDEQYVNDLKNELQVVNQKLKSTETKLDSMMDLVYKTFNGDGSAADELSRIVGVAPPILYCDDEMPKNDPPKLIHQNSNRETNNRFNNRMEFLNQVMSDHDKMMMNNYSKPRTASANRRNRVRSADRMTRKSDRTYFNPYTWSLNEHTHVNNDSIYKHNAFNSITSCSSKPLLNKCIKSRPETRQNTSCDVKIEDFLNHSANKRSVKSPYFGKPSVQLNDFKLTCDSESNISNISKPPKATRPTSSLSYSRNNSAKSRLKNKNSSPYHNLNLQPMVDSDNKAEELLKAMEKRFELSTIDLQRRLGISQAGMVGP